MVAVGLLVPDRPPGMSLVDIARSTERAGFDSIWSGDHLLASVDGLVAATAFGAATERIVVGTSVYLPHLRPTVAVARMLATIDAAGLADRFVFGVGVGGDVPDEFEVVGLDMRRRGRLLDAFLSELHALLGTDPPTRFDEHGPSPRIWVGGRSEAAARRAVRAGCGFAPYLVTPERFGALARQALEERVDSGPFDIGLNVLIAADVDGVSGAELARRARPFGLDDQQIERYVVTGSVEQCMDELATFVECGATHLVLNPAVPATYKKHHLDLLGAELLPRLQRLRPAAGTERRTG